MPSNRPCSALWRRLTTVGVSPSVGARPAILLSRRRCASAGASIVAPRVDGWRHSTIRVNSDASTSASVLILLGDRAPDVGIGLVAAGECHHRHLAAGLARPACRRIGGRGAAHWRAWRRWRGRRGRQGRRRAIVRHVGAGREQIVGDRAGWHCRRRRGRARSTAWPVAGGVAPARTCAAALGSAWLPVIATRAWSEVRADVGSRRARIGGPQIVVGRHDQRRPPDHGKLVRRTLAHAERVLDRAPSASAKLQETCHHQSDSQPAPHPSHLLFSFASRTLRRAGPGRHDGARTNKRLRRPSRVLRRERGAFLWRTMYIGGGAPASHPPRSGRHRRRCRRRRD